MNLSIHVLNILTNNSEVQTTKWTRNLLYRKITGTFILYVVTVCNLILNNNQLAYSVAGIHSTMQAFQTYRLTNVHYFHLINNIDHLHAVSESKRALSTSVSLYKFLTVHLPLFLCYSHTNYSPPLKMTILMICSQSL